VSTILAFFQAINPWSAVIGAFTGSLSVVVAYFVNQWITKQNQKRAAVSSMAQDMDAHASDGALSVDDMRSGQSQIDDLKSQLAQMDAQAPIPPAQPPTQQPPKGKP
jgi:hypothetical protein